MSETPNYFATMTFRFADFVLTVFPHVDCNRLGTNGGGGGGGGCYLFFRLSIHIYFYIQNTENTRLFCV